MALLVVVVVGEHLEPLYLLEPFNRSSNMQWEHNLDFEVVLCMCSNKSMCSANLPTVSRTTKACAPD